MQGDLKSVTEEEAGQEVVEKHPLQHPWQLWYWRNTPGRTWEQNLLKVAKFQTVEDFWALHHHIEIASNLQPGSDYNLFKNDIKPMWEDSANYAGGRWLFTIQKPGMKEGQGKQQSHSKTLDNMWLEVLLCVIGEAFDKYSDQICGAVLNVRPKVDKIAVWTSDCKDMAAAKFIGQVLKERTGFKDRIVFESHADTAQKKSSTAKYLIAL